VQKVPNEPSQGRVVDVVGNETESIPLSKHRSGDEREWEKVVNAEKAEKRVFEENQAVRPAASRRRSNPTPES
jgi:hypothetical protein